MQNVMQALYLTRNARGLPASARRYSGEVTDMEEKKQALAAIMAHYEPEKSFVFTDEQAQHVAAFRLDVAELTCKERS